MKRFLALGVILLLLAALISACGKDEDSESTPASTEVTPSGQDEAEGALRTLAAWDKFTLYGPLKDALCGGFEQLSLSGPRSAEDATAASVSFTLGKPRDGGYLKLAGSVYLGKDASSLVDLDLDEDEAEVDPDALLFDAAADKIKDSGGSVQQKENNGIAWNYGFAENSEGDAAVLHLFAWAKLDGGLLYVDITAADQKGGSLAAMKQPMENWLLRLTLGTAPDAAKQEIRIPFGGKTLAAEDIDALSPYGATLSWNAGEGYLSAAYEGVREDYSFYLSLENKAAAGTDPSRALEPAPKDALESPLNWKTAKAENVLTATADIENDTLWFELVLEPEEGAAPDAAFEEALDWLKTVTIR